MSLLFIRPEVCVGCGLCVKVCPVGILRQSESGPSSLACGKDRPGAGASPRPVVPTVAAGRERHCILCGHCQAVCPVAALVHPGLADHDPGLPETTDDPGGAGAGEGLASGSPAGVCAASAFMELVARRRSCRHFKEAPLSRERLAGLCAAARFAPSGHNQRQVEWAVVESRRGMDAVLGLLAEWMDAEVRADTNLARGLNLAGALRAVGKGRDVVLRGAPHLVVAHAPRAGLTPREDALIACAHLDLAAQALGLGSCWCGYAMFALAAAALPEPEAAFAGGWSSPREAGLRLAGLLGIAGDRQGFGALLIGRKAHGFARPAPRRPFPLRFVL